MAKNRYLSILNQIKESGGKIDGGQPNDKVLIIDGLNTFIRVFSVIPTTNDDGIHVGGIVGFLKSVGYAISMIRPTRTIMVFDGKGGSNRRRKIYSEYKNKKRTKYRLNRSNDFSSVEDERQNMIMQLSRSVEYLNCLPMTIVSIDNIEADDSIAYISEQCLTDSNIVIMSTDKDFLQLVDDRVSVWSPVRKKLYKPNDILEEYGIDSKNYIWYRVLDGDKSDNIPGVKGLGLKTIQKKFPFLNENRIVNIGEVIKELPNAKEVIELNYKLMQLSNVDISGNAKMKIRNLVNNPIQRLIKVDFQKMFLEDKLYAALPNLNSWLATTFNRLNNMAEKSYGKKT
jgi:5'-3' exonuclease|tara:strand:+ start:371 stop:1396 length:1026 start_codon:yes stop_codon:yes gene_type:complete